MRGTLRPLTFRLFFWVTVASAGCSPAALKPRAGSAASSDAETSTGAADSPGDGLHPESIVRRTFGALREHDQEMVDKAVDYRLQAAFTHFPAGAPPVHDTFRLGAEYLYPASAIKIFASAGLLLWIQEKRKDVASLGTDSEILACPQDGGRCEVIADKSNRESRTLTVGHVVRKMHLVSDNKAFNTLYDLVGHRELHQRFWALGYSSLRVHHRMFSKGDAAEQKLTPRFQLRTRTGELVEVPRRDSDLVLPATPATGLRVGVAHRAKTGHLLETPMDFSQKNFVSIADLHRLIVALHRSKAASDKLLPLDPDLRAFLIDATTTLPHRSSNPRYSHLRETWGRFKPLCRGLSTLVGAEAISCANKAGNAYGFLIENTYLRNEATGAALAITVGMYVNPNGVINDDEYTYEEEGRPLLAAIGAAAARQYLLGN